MGNWINVEIKARCDHPENIRRELQSASAAFHGTDHQVDTYFRTARGRLKLREGNIENALIHYQRPDETGPKRSDVTLYPIRAADQLKSILLQALEVWVVVDKQREIYFIDNVKFHIDTVRFLGSFVEIEAIDRGGELGEAYLRKQCEAYLRQFGINPKDLVQPSYSDLMYNRNNRE